MSRSARMVGAALIPAFALPLAAGPARAAVPQPPTNKNLPQDLDVASPYVPQSTCDPDPKPGVTAFARLMANHYEEFSYGISRECNHGLTEHSEGRALDWMLDANDPHEREVADSVISWLLAPDDQGRPAAMARRFGIMYIIWNRQIWGTYQMSDGWRPYNGPSPHTDHIHFSFSWDGAMQRTSWWTGKAWQDVTTTPGGPSVPVLPPDGYPTLREGSRGPDVQLAQRVIGVTADGVFGPDTKAALREWQGEHGLTRTGVLDDDTWNRMVAEGEVSARGEDDGGIAKYFDTSVRLGSTGEAVKALQRELGVTVDGVFGRRTDKAVRDLQRSKSLRADGVVTANVWHALAGLDYTRNAKKPDKKPDRKPEQEPAPTPEPEQTPQPEATSEPEPEKTTAPTPEESGSTEPAPEGTSGNEQPEEAKGEPDAEPTPTPSGSPDSTSPTTSPAPSSSPSKGSVVRTDTWFTRVKDEVLARGSHGSAVKVLQRGLGGVAVDGNFGATTERAVATFQRAHGIRATGVVDEDTWEALEVRAFPLLHYRTMVLKPGSSGDGVSALQRHLGVEETGTFDDETRAAVKELQARHGLARTGYVGAVTWEALEEEARPYERNH
ncbi:peptidoglycan-binding protein [Janibacter corallicola]|uniref:peptidoglycan-binding protein n=1 Tax=Janibacter corallicola TaxID=415212 RepID=UPI000AAABAA2|nr:peptidoglycan-binding protein [Janibacter corallicola]